jgi:hypothetical protein
LPWRLVRQLNRGTGRSKAVALASIGPPEAP